jgi:hypothetical protein
MLIPADLVSSGCKGAPSSFVETGKDVTNDHTSCCQVCAASHKFRPQPTGAELKVDIKVLLAFVACSSCEHSD